MVEKTREWYYEKHQEMWNIIARICTDMAGGKADKTMSVTSIEELALNTMRERGSIGHNEYPINNCFACAYSFPDCGACLLTEWYSSKLFPPGQSDCFSVHSVYRTFITTVLTDNFRGAAMCALKIANLPLREKLA